VSVKTEFTSTSCPSHHCCYLAVNLLHHLYCVLTLHQQSNGTSVIQLINVSGPSLLGFRQKAPYTQNSTSRCQVFPLDEMRYSRAQSIAVLGLVLFQ